MELPEAFNSQMREQLGTDYNRFLESFERPRTHGLRFNRLKLPPGHPLREAYIQRFSLSPVGWCEDGYRYPEGMRPGLHPGHAAGLYYLQEPSAMSAAPLLNPQPGDAVLDLAAAPGGKSTQIAAALGGQGYLVANEIHPDRARTLSENVERFGAANVLVANMPPDALAERYPARFDKILLDAPCSGEGMFRKNPLAAAEWSPEQVQLCAARQRDILPHAVRMLKPGGRLVYSTCTFNRVENEEMMAWIIREHPGLKLAAEKRIWPHLDQGEGHYAAVLELAPNHGEPQIRPARRASAQAKSSAGRQASELGHALALWERFRRDALPDWAMPDGEPLLFGAQLYLLPRGLSGVAGLRGLKALRPGLHLGEAKKDRFEPSHALALALPREAYGTVLDLKAQDGEWAAYLRGEALQAPADLRGWVLVACEGFALGWGKPAGGRINNRYPKGLRR